MVSVERVWGSVAVVIKKNHFIKKIWIDWHVTEADGTTSETYILAVGEIDDDDEKELFHLEYACCKTLL